MMKRLTKRFSYLLLDDGDSYIQDWVATCVCPLDEAEDSEFGFQHLHQQKLNGRLRLCSKSVFFEPDDAGLPIFMFPLSKVQAIKTASKAGQVSPSSVNGGSSMLHKENSFILETSMVVKMKENGLDAPYIFDQKATTWWFSLEYAPVQQFVQQAQSLLSINGLVYSERDMILANATAQREASATFDTSRLVDLGEHVLIDLCAAQVTPLVREPGRFVLTQRRVYFQPLHNLNNDSPVRSYLLGHIVAVARRRHSLRHVGLEIFLDSQVSSTSGASGADVAAGGLLSDGPSRFFTFNNRQEREMAVSRILAQIGGSRSSPASLGLLLEADPTALKNITSAWQLGAISNYAYLMYLNLASGRTFNDLTQWPVMPWVLADYTSNTLDLSNPATFRDLTKPIGALNRARMAIFWERFEQMPRGDEKNPPFLYGTHYSTPGYVLYWLVRSAPGHMLRLQSGRFDAPDRLFSSIKDSWDSVLNNSGDLKELVPEFFALPSDFLNMREGLHLGVRQNGEPIGDVALPPWASSTDDFIVQQRLALESPFVSSRLHHWIDLVFGAKQRGEAALAANNLFHHLTYEGAVDLDSINDPVERAGLEAQINEFGQAPCQLFREPHVQRQRMPTPGSWDVYAECARGSRAMVVELLTRAAATLGSLTDLGKPPPNTEELPWYPEPEPEPMHASLLGEASSPPPNLHGSLPPTSGQSSGESRGRRISATSSRQLISRATSALFSRASAALLSTSSSFSPPSINRSPSPSSSKSVSKDDNSCGCMSADVASTPSSKSPAVPRGTSSPPHADVASTPAPKLSVLPRGIPARSSADGPASRGPASPPKKAKEMAAALLNTLSTRAMGSLSKEQEALASDEEKGGWISKEERRGEAKGLTSGEKEMGVATVRGEGHSGAEVEIKDESGREGKGVMEGGKEAMKDYLSNADPDADADAGSGMVGSQNMGLRTGGEGEREGEGRGQSGFKEEVRKAVKGSSGRSVGGVGEGGLSRGVGVSVRTTRKSADKDEVAAVGKAGEAHAVKGGDSGTRRAWHWMLRHRLPEPVRVKAHRGPVNGIAVSDSNASDSLSLFSVGKDGFVKVHSISEGFQVRARKLGNLPLTSLALAQSGEAYPTVLAGSFDNCVHAYSVDFGRALGRMRTHDDAVSCVAVTRGGSGSMVTASWDTSVKLWSLDEGRGSWGSEVAARMSWGPEHTAEPVAAMAEHEAAIWALDVDYEGKLAVSGSEDGVVMAWDTRSPFQPIWQRSVSRSPAAALALHVDGTRVCTASGDGRLRLLDMRLSGGEVGAVECGDGPLRSCALAGAVALGGSMDGALHFWRLDDVTGRESQKSEEEDFLDWSPICDHAMPLNCITIFSSKDETSATLATGSDDGDVLIYHVK